jgi:SAM-dependent methyltransferase
VQRGDWSRIAHGELEFMGPYDGGHLERLFRGIELPERARVLDLGCGTGALLAWLAARSPIDGLGVDLRPPRRSIPGVRFQTGDADGVIGGGRDLVCSVGAVSQPRELAALARRGGLVLYGNGYWRRRPSRRYLEALGAEPDELDRWQRTLRQGEGIGLELVAAVRSNRGDWDRYEDAWAGNGERYAAEHAGEPGVDEFAAWIRSGRRRYRELGGRDTLGFALLLWRVPA